MGIIGGTRLYVADAAVKTIVDAVRTSNRAERIITLSQGGIRRGHLVAVGAGVN
jgi:hypothetical protein